MLRVLKRKTPKTKRKECDLDTYDIRQTEYYRLRTLELNILEAT